ncbi:hypothetical protein OEA41_007170 [Lepraria neglecta]|uniref:NWD NACHT-NTPase N-terminal domain-containing protein n=1 Tax=Lepraria neglecta TaxID=209136 RepID=A0AAD9ZCA6_9LECA|nr:hypothetical protein OEA41_007170 [Lepraria neglecta]
MSALVTKKLAAMNSRQWRINLGRKSIEIRREVDRILKIVAVAKGFGTSLTSIDPVDAGIPWAGVCVLLPLLLNDSQQRQMAIDGLEYIAQLIRRYAEVERIYLRRIDHRLNRDLEAALSHVLEFEARAFCQFARNTGLQAMRNIVKIDGWEAILNTIKESETDCDKLTGIIDAKCQHTWHEQLEASISEQARKVDELLVHSQAQDKEC